MTLTLKGLSSNGKRAIYTGAAIAVTLGVSLFPNKEVPQTLTSLDQFAGPKPARVPRAQMTPEEKEAAKQARKNAPKKTIAEQIAAAEQRAAALRAKLAAGESASL